MSTFEHPTQQPHTPEQASFEPTPPPEAIEREKTQIDAVSGIQRAIYANTLKQMYNQRL